MSFSKYVRNQGNIPVYRQRYNPTFVHQQIFNNQACESQVIKCSPTFYSTALNNDGYNVITIHQKPAKTCVRPNTALQSVYINNSQQRRVQDLNPHKRSCCSSRDKWFDNTKEQLIQSLKNCRYHGYSKDRKYVDLSSALVFTDYKYGNINQDTHLGQYQTYEYPNPNQQNIPQPHEIQQGTQTVPQIVGSNNIVQQKDIKIGTNNQHIQSMQAPLIQQQKIVNRNTNKGKQTSTRKDFHKSCIPQYEKTLKLKGKKIAPRPESVKRKVISQKPTFTVIRKNKIPLL